MKYSVLEALYFCFSSAFKRYFEKVKYILLAEIGKNASPFLNTSRTLQFFARKNPVETLCITFGDFYDFIIFYKEDFSRFNKIVST